MPNGVSCLYFAGKNLIYGKKENNIFKNGIGVIQSIRGADFLTKSAVSAKGAVNAAEAANAGLLSKAASTLKRCLYPLIILSGIYNTAKSKDKVKIGAQQAGGIGFMYTLENIAEKGLNIIDKKIMSNPANQNNKKIRVLWYIAKGMAFTIASVTGYKLGSKTMGNTIDKLRDNKARKAAEKEIKQQMEAMLKENTPQTEDEKLFEDIETIIIEE